MTSNPSAEAVLLSVFFGPGNAHSASHREAPKTYGSMMARTNPMPVLLPRRDGVGIDWWYAIARSNEQVVEAREGLLAFIGPSYSTFSGELARPAVDDAIDAAVAEFTGGRFFKLQVPPGESRRVGVLADRLQRMWTQRSGRTRTLSRSLERLQRDFEMALTVGRWSLAEETIELLQAEGRLSRRNLAFLRIRLLAEQGRWGDVLALPELETVLSGRRPAPVTRALNQAVYEFHLRPFQVRGEPAEQLAHFRFNVLPAYRAIFGTRAGSIEPAGVLCALLLDICEGGAEQAEQLVDLLPPGSTHSEWARALSEARVPTPKADPVDSIDAAQAAIRAGRLDEAVAAAEQVESPVERLRLLLEVAADIGTPGAAKSALGAFAACSEEERRRALRGWRAAAAWSRIQEQFGEQARAVEEDQFLPADWRSWLTAIASTPPDGVHRYTPSSEWALFPGGFTVEACVELDRLLTDASNAGAVGLIIQASPALVASIRREGPRAPALGEFLDTFMLLLHDDELATLSDLDAISELVEYRLDSGLATSAYEDVLGLVESVWERRQSRIALDWALELIDLLIDYPCPARQRRARLVQSVLSRASGWVRKLDATTVRYARQLCGEADLEELGALLESGASGGTKEEKAPEQQPSLAGLRAAIYTLTERAGKRAKRLLEDAFPGVRVDLCFDKVASPRLRSLARNADIFVMCTQSAKHAATEAIESARSKDKVLLRPGGKGASSIVREVVVWARREAPSGPSA